KIFDDLAYRHYKDGNWAAMLHAALRMRTTTVLSKEICEILDGDQYAAKGLLRINRPKLFRTLSGLAPKIPLTLDNMVYLWAHGSPRDFKIKALIPQVLRETFEV